MKVGYEVQKWTAQTWVLFAFCCSGMLFMLSVVVYAGVQSFHEFSKQQPVHSAPAEKKSP